MLQWDSYIGSQREGIPVNGLTNVPLGFHVLNQQWTSFRSQVTGIPLARLIALGRCIQCRFIGCRSDEAEWNKVLLFRIPDCYLVDIRRNQFFQVLQNHQHGRFQFQVRRHCFQEGGSSLNRSPVCITRSSWIAEGQHHGAGTRQGYPVRNHFQVLVSDNKQPRARGGA